MSGPKISSHATFDSQNTVVTIPGLNFVPIAKSTDEFSVKQGVEKFKKRGYPASVILTAHHRAQRTDRQSALKTSQKENNHKIPFTHTFHPHNNPVKPSSLTNE